MKIITLISVLVSMSILSFASYAGDGHGHSHGNEHSHGGGHSHSHETNEIAKEQTGVIGRTHVERLIKLKKIDSSWKSSMFDKSEKKSFKGKTEWLVTFKNEKGVKGKKLYIFLKLSGEFVAANFTGK